MRVTRWMSQVIVASLVFSGISIGLAIPAQATSCPATPAAPQYLLPSGTIHNGDVFTICDFRGWDFSLQSANNVDFSISYLANAKFNGSTFTNSTFGNNSSHNIDFTGANLTGARIIGDLSSSIFDHTNLSNANLHFAHLDGANLRDANLTNANMNNVFLDGAILAYANLTGADLTDAYLRGANLTNSTGTAATQSQLAVAQLDEFTICPDSYPLGTHVGNCFGALVAPTPTTTPPVVGTTGFTFDITNSFPEYYNFTVAVTSGPGTAASTPPQTGHTQPVVVTGAPQGSKTVVTITSSFNPGSGPITSTTSYDYQAEVAKELARTGLNQSQVWGFGVTGSALILFGAAAIYLARRRKN